MLGKRIWSLVSNIGGKTNENENRMKTPRIKFGNGKVLCDLDSSSFKRVGRAEARL